MCAEIGLSKKQDQNNNEAKDGRHNIFYINIKIMKLQQYLGLYQRNIDYELRIGPSPLDYFCRLPSLFNAFLNILK